VAGNTSQICEYELIAHDSLANDYGNLKIEHWAAIVSIDELVAEIRRIR
jgi:hypothetical protein